MIDAILHPELRDRMILLRGAQSLDTAIGGLADSYSPKAGLIWWTVCTTTGPRSPSTATMFWRTVTGNSANNGFHVTSKAIRIFLMLFFLIPRPQVLGGSSDFECLQPVEAREGRARATYSGLRDTGRNSKCTVIDIKCACDGSRMLALLVLYLCLYDSST